MGILQYTQDYDEKMPSAGTAITNTAPNSTNKNTWMDRAFPYVKSTQMFDCPSDSHLNKLGASYSFPAYIDTSGVFHTGIYYGNDAYYLPNDNLNAPLNDANFMRGGISIAAFAEASTTVLVTDAIGNNDSAVFYSTSVAQDLDISTVQGLRTFRSNDQGNMEITGPVERHLDTANVLFCDGHVKSMKLDVLTAKSTTTGAYRFFTTEAD